MMTKDELKARIWNCKDQLREIALKLETLWMNLEVKPDPQPQPIFGIDWREIEKEYKKAWRAGVAASMAEVAIMEEAILKDIIAKLKKQPKQKRWVLTELPDGDLWGIIDAFTMAMVRWCGGIWSQQWVAQAECDRRNAEVEEPLTPPRYYADDCNDGHWQIRYPNGIELCDVFSEGAKAHILEALNAN